MALPVRSWVGQSLGYQQQIDQARAALARAEQQRDTARRVAQAIGSDATADEVKAAQAERELMFLLAQISALQQIASIQQQISAPQSTSQQTPSPASAFETSATNAFEVVFEGLVSHDSEIDKVKEDNRLVRAAFYRGTFSLAYDRARSIALGVGIGSLVGAIVIVPLIVGFIATIVYARKRERIERALNDFNGLVNLGGDPRKAFWQACARHKVDDDDLNIEDAVKSGRWQHPYPA